MRRVSPIRLDRRGPRLHLDRSPRWPYCHRRETPNRQTSSSLSTWACPPRARGCDQPTLRRRPLRDRSVGIRMQADPARLRAVPLRPCAPRVSGLRVARHSKRCTWDPMGPSPSARTVSTLGVQPRNEEHPTSVRPTNERRSDPRGPHTNRVRRVEFEQFGSLSQRAEPPKEERAPAEWPQRERHPPSPSVCRSTIDIH
jgi:hypothetical protein